jgi:hypothetical protein
MDEMKSPPRLCRRFFRWFCHPDLLPGVEGDLMELYTERLAESGKRKADRRFIIDVLLLFRLGLLRPGIFRLFGHTTPKSLTEILFAIRRFLRSTFQGL